MAAGRLTEMMTKSLPKEVAALVRFLCGTEAASITGAVLPIEGGWTAH